MDDAQSLRNEIRPGETLADTLLRQMDEAGTRDYWEAVRYYSELERRREESLSKALLGFPLF